MVCVRGRRNAIGVWPEEFAASCLPQRGKGARYNDMLGAGRPSVLLGGMVPAAFERIAAVADGWVAPFFGYEMLSQGVDSVRRAWAAAGRFGAPRVVVE
jgi:alkanesulfonate monooxygenase SsuD/methylene tetrahydromethanopterin reductase-like flavin-dependent oxidoreductase (luciferase family)